MFLAFWNKLRQKLSLPIFFIDGKYWVWCYPNLCNIRRCYPNILSVCPAHPGQGIPTELSSSLTRECHIVSVVTRGRWGHNTRVRCGPQIIYICAVISAQLSSSPAYVSPSLSDSLHENSVTRIMSIINTKASLERAAEWCCSDPWLQHYVSMSQHHVWSDDPGDHYSTSRGVDHWSDRNS